VAAFTIVWNEYACLFSGIGRLSNIKITDGNTRNFNLHSPVFGNLLFGKKIDFPPTKK
jgi:hypothetical protein